MAEVTDVATGDSVKVPIARLPKQLRQRLYLARSEAGVTTPRRRRQTPGGARS
jgi:hypothetical protein